MLLSHLSSNLWRSWLYSYLLFCFYSSFGSPISSIISTHLILDSFVVFILKWSIASLPYWHSFGFVLRTRRPKGHISACSIEKTLTWSLKWYIPFTFLSVCLALKNLSQYKSNFRVRWTLLQRQSKLFAD